MESNISQKITISSIISCPKCGFDKEENMPINSCQFFYQCTKCDELLRPKDGDCCVYCSYGSIICPHKQENSSKPCC